jgi:prephenate dehydrogenase
MSAQVPPLLSRIGIVGYGEVGRILAEDLRARGVAPNRAYDVKQGTPAE